MLLPEKLSRPNECLGGFVWTAVLRSVSFRIAGKPSCMLASNDRSFSPGVSVITQLS